MHFLQLPNCVKISHNKKWSIGSGSLPPNFFLKEMKMEANESVEKASGRRCNMEKNCSIECTINVEDNFRAK